MISQRNPNSPAITMRPASDGSKTIGEIDLSKVTLQFAEKTESG